MKQLSRGEDKRRNGGPAGEGSRVSGGMQVRPIIDPEELMLF